MKWTDPDAHTLDIVALALVGMVFVFLLVSRLFMGGA